jgi:hypothetical protein
MALVDVPVGAVAYPTRRVMRNVLIWVALLARLGKTTTCFSRSILLCRTMRQCGVEARITFGALPDECQGDRVVRRIRHCWVEEAGDTGGDEWLPVFKFP